MHEKKRERVSFVIATHVGKCPEAEGWSLRMHGWLSAQHANVGGRSVGAWAVCMWQCMWRCGGVQKAALPPLPLQHTWKVISSDDCGGHGRDGGWRCKLRLVAGGREVKAPRRSCRLPHIRGYKPRKAGRMDATESRRKDGWEKSDALGAAVNQGRCGRRRATRSARRAKNI
eukprot:350594-Chlamydomonas_euryale.AAC.12